MFLSADIIFSGTKNLFLDLSRKLQMIVIPAIGIIVIIINFIQMLQAEAQEQTHYKKNIRTVILIVILAELIIPLLTWVLSFYNIGLTT